uniref:Bacteriophage T5 Orf172 DNA-binding domain-containing protein n=1 Tax=Moniliophthora roreri TaxID=221103 RepID=A0A0W0F0Q2_MONRR
MGTMYKIKGKIKDLIAEQLDLVPQSSSGPDPSSSPPPLPQRPHSDNHDLVQSFDALALSGGTRPNASDPSFVGGFNPYSQPQGSGSGPGLPPRPPPVPMPDANYHRKSSLTMQYALNPPRPDASAPNLLTPNYISGSPPSRPYSAPNFPKPVYANAYPPASSPYPFNPSTPNVYAGAQSVSPAKPLPSIDTSNTAQPGKKPSRPRASSTPPTPTSNTSGASGQIQCSGITKAGKRCTRVVKNGPALTGVMGSNTINGQTIERYCFQHTKELLSPTGFYARKQSSRTQEWIDFADYIPEYLHPDTQVALRVEMEKARSSSDVEGYIYTFEIRDPNSPRTIKLKVGRTTNVVKRLNQWGKQCGSKEQVLRGWYPGTVDPDDDDDDDLAGQSLMKGRAKDFVLDFPTERLVHLELADLAVNRAYLEPGWKPFAKGKGKGKSQNTIQITSSNSASSANGTTSPKKGKGGKNNAGVFTNGLGNGGGFGPCKDCGTIHKEIFEFARIEKGPYKGREWEAIVKRVIDEWGEFVEQYV